MLGSIRERRGRANHDETVAQADRDRVASEEIDISDAML
jgi:hypothetical protein